MGTVLNDFRLEYAEPIVNVASVRHLSPFRYPGGKTWLVPRVTRYIRSMNRPPTAIVDPFMGGGSIPLSVLVDGLVKKAFLYEIDSNVASVWKTVFSKDADKLCKLIASFELNRENVLDLLATEPKDTLNRAFQTVVRNRTFRGGILAAGASLIKTGENGRGISSRWYPETLISRITVLKSLQHRIEFHETDGVEAIASHTQKQDSFIFVDPPYTVGTGKRAGSRLYNHNNVDHERVFSLLSCGTAPFMMTYDDDIDVLGLAKRHCFVLEYVSMKNSHHNCMQELVITR